MTGPLQDCVEKMRQAGTCEDELKIVSTLKTGEKAKAHPQKEKHHEGNLPKLARCKGRGNLRRMWGTILGLRMRLRGSGWVRAVIEPDPEGL